MRNTNLGIFLVATEDSNITIAGNSTHSESSSPENTNSDDFVLVPTNLPTDPTMLDYERKYAYEKDVLNIRNFLIFISFRVYFPSHTRAQQTAGGQQKTDNANRVSPAFVEQNARPNTLPISEPKPVPLASNVRRIRPAASVPQKSVAYVRDDKSTGYNTESNVPRSQPISMKRSDQRNCNDVNNMNNAAATAPSAINISSISPPAVQFAIGSPPLGSRRRSTSSLSESPGTFRRSTFYFGTLSNSSFAVSVAPYLWQISPTTQQSPPIRESSSQQMLQQGSEISRHIASDALGDHAFHCATAIWNVPGMFNAPDLPVETLLDRTHNETLAKLNFVVALCDCILEVADAKCAPLSALMSAEAAPMAPHAPEHCKRSERLVLLVR